MVDLILKLIAYVVIAKYIFLAFSSAVVVAAYFIEQWVERYRDKKARLLEESILRLESIETLPRTGEYFIGVHMPSGTKGWVCWHAQKDGPEYLEWSNEELRGYPTHWMKPPKFRTEIEQLTKE